MIDVVFLYTKDTRYSINALLAAIDLDSRFSIHLADSLDRLLEIALALRNKGRKVVVALSLMTTMLSDDGFLEKLRSTLALLRNEGCFVVCGGPHASGDPLGTLKSIGCDYVVIGEGEETFKELVEAIEENIDVKRVKGIAYLENGKFIFTGRRKLVNLDDYHPFPYWRRIFNPIEITRGCPYGCFYCQVSYVHGAMYRHRSIEKIVFYSRTFFEKGGRDLRFITPNGLAYGLKTMSKTPELVIVEELLEAIKREADKHGGKRIFLGTFPSEVRPEHVTQESMRVLRKYVANRGIIMGVQSGSERVLEMIHRGHTVEDVLRAVESAREAGFTPIVDLIVGFPGETLDDMLQTLELAKTVVDKGGLVHLHHYIPLPGTPFGLKTPSHVPDRVKKELAKLVGRGKGYGDWLKQEVIAWRIVELYRKGLIYPRSIAPGFIN